MTYCVGLIGLRSEINTVRHHDLGMVDAKKRPRGENMVVLVYRMASAVRILAIPSHPPQMLTHNFQTTKSNDLISVRFVRRHQSFIRQPCLR